MRNPIYCTPLTVYHTWNFTGVLEMRAFVNSSVPFGGAAKHPQVHQAAVVAVESCCHEPRVEAVRRHPGIQACPDLDPQLAPGRATNGCDQSDPRLSLGAWHCGTSGASLPPPTTSG